MSGIIRKVSAGRRLISWLLILTLSLMVVFGLYRFNVLLYHGVVEILGVVMAGAIFMFAWNARKYMATSYFTIIGVGYLAVAILDFMHTYTYPGMMFIPHLRQDAGMQFWVAARFVESVSLFLSLAFGRRKMNERSWPLISIGVCLIFSAVIIVWPIFPTCFVPGEGLTLFRIGGEYLIILILFASVYLLHRHQQFFESDVRQLLVGAICVTIVSEVAVTLNTDVYGVLNVMGHWLKLISVFLIYQIIVKTGLLKPSGLVVNHLSEHIRERSKIGAELKERNLMFKTLVQAIPDMVSYKDMQGRYLIANSAHRTFFGINEASVIGATDQALGTILPEEEDAEQERMRLDEGKTIRFESIMRSASGYTSHWDIRKVPVKNRRGDMVGILNLARDISPFKQREFELQQSKALLQAFLDGISDPMLMIDNHLHVVYSNRAAAKVYRLDKGGGAHICTQVFGDDSGQCDTHMIKSLLAKKKPASFELSSVDSHRVDKVYVYPFSDKTYGLEGAVVRIADITEAKGVERHLIHSEKMNALGMLVAGMVHEINNPNSFISFNLPILRAYLEKIFKMLDSHPVTATHEDWFGMDYPSFRNEMYNLIDNLSHGSSRIDNIILNLKMMTHPKQISSQKKWVDLFDVIDKAVVLCRSEIRKRVKVFEVTPPPKAIRIKTDPEALEQVIINLLINASHAADKRESWVRIAVTSSKDAHDQSVIEVSDNGCGMTTETKSRIFNPFYTTKGPGVGTGLGLSVSYNLIRQLGGEILVDSIPDEGTRFRVVLPREAAADSGLTLGLEKTTDTGPHLGIGNEKGMNNGSSDTRCR